MRSLWHFNTSGFNVRFPRTPQNENKNLKKCSSDYFHILHIVELWCDFKMFVGPWSIYIYNVYEFCWPMYTDLGRPGDTCMCGCGRPSNLVNTYIIFNDWWDIMFVDFLSVCLCIRYTLMGTTIYSIFIKLQLNLPVNHGWIVYLEWRRYDFHLRAWP